MNPDSSVPLLERLCDLQQQQLEKLAELSKHLSETAAEARKNYDGYRTELTQYEQTLQTYQESDARHSKDAMRRGIIIASMLALIAVSIIVSRFL